MLSLQKASAKDATVEEEDDGEVTFTKTSTEPSPKEILRQALIAYKRGASIAHDNWKIWDNVITIAGRMSPPSFPEILLGTRNILRIRGPSIGENAVDIDILRALVLEVTSRGRTDGEVGEGGVYVPLRGSLARATIQMVEDEVVPLITKRAELWTLVEKLALYRRDFAGALSCAEKAWRMSQGEGWLEKEEMWKGVVAATDNLVSAYENYGPQEKADGSGEVEEKWKMKARSAIRGVMGKAKDPWEGTAEWEVLRERGEELKNL